MFSDLGNKYWWRNRLRLISRGYLYIAYYPLLFFLKLRFRDRYQVYRLPEWRKGNNFCFLIRFRTDYQILYVIKYSNPIFSAINCLIDQRLPGEQAHNQAVQLLMQSKVYRYVPNLTFFQNRLAIEYLPSAIPVSKLNNPPYWIVTTLCSMVAEFHQTGLAHGDLCSHNILYEPNQEKIYLVDLEYLSLLTQQLQTRDQQKLDYLIYRWHQSHNCHSLPLGW